MTPHTRELVKMYLDDVTESAPGISRDNLIDLIVLEFALTVDEANDVYREWMRTP